MTSIGLERGPVHITFSHRDWFLCEEAEKRFQRAKKDRSLVLVDNIFLMKYVGRLAAIALYDKTLPDGSEIHAGEWYTPVDNVTRDQVKENFKDGKTHIETVSSRWLRLRSIEPENFNGFWRIMGERYVVSRLRAVARHLPKELPNNFKTARGIVRRENYKNLAEEY